MKDFKRVGAASWLALSAILGLLLGSQAIAGDQPLKMSSGEHQTKMIELFTSEGCSSCPPADRWLSSFVDSPVLWDQVVPLAFHVDYWDGLGWEDDYATPRNSLRQRWHRAEGNISAVYTPGFVVTGREWKGWFRGESLPLDASSSAGVLSAAIKDDQVDLMYAAQNSGEQLVYNVAVLGFGIETEVEAGENHGRTLHHDFVVLSHQQVESNDGAAMLTLDGYQRPESQRYALAVWVNRPGEQEPLQATGGWL